MFRAIRISIILLIIVTGSFFMYGCGSNTDEELTSSKSASRITKSDDKAIQYLHSKVELIAEESNDLEITHVASILPVEVDGAIVQANDIIIQGNKAFIAYNFAGDPFRGAIQILDIHKPEHPEIVHEIKFMDMEINALYVDGQKLYFAGAGDPDVWEFKSFIGRIEDVNKMNISGAEKSITGLSSHAATGIAKKSNLYVGVGARDGKLEVLDKELNKIDSAGFSDIRDVDEFQNGIVALAGTTDNTNTHGRVLIFDKNDLDNPVEIAVEDFSSDYHKATIEVHKGKTLLLGLSEAGFKAMDLKHDTYEIIYELANPEDEDVLETNTNSVSSDANLIFTANGAFGFRVLKIHESHFDDIELIGHVSFKDQNFSANHIEFKSNHLFVASGLGGVNIYLLKHID